MSRTGTTTRDRTGRPRRSAERRPQAAVTPLARPRRRARAPAAGSRRPIRLAVALLGGGRGRLAAPGQSACSASGPCRWTASTTLPADQVREAAGIEAGTPLLRVDVDAAAARGRAAAPGGLGRGHPRLAAHRRHHGGRAGAGRRRRRAGPALAGRRRGRAVRHGDGGAARPASCRSTWPSPDPATRPPWPRWPRSARCPPSSASEVAGATAASAEDISLTLDRRHAGALGRRGAVRPEGRGARRRSLEQLADGDLEPAGDDRRQHARGRRPPLTRVAPGPAIAHRRGRSGQCWQRRLVADRAPRPQRLGTTRRNRDTPDTEHLSSRFPVREHIRVWTPHETFPGRVVTPSGADVTNESPVFGAIRSDRHADPGGCL